MSKWNQWRTQRTKTYSWFLQAGCLTTRYAARLGKLACELSGTDASTQG
jgi:hypothetical protein